MLAPTFQHPCIDKEDDATFPLLSFQVHGMGCLQKKPHRSPAAIGRVIHGQTLAIPPSHLCPLCLGAALGSGALAAAHRHCSSFAPESFFQLFLGNNCLSKYLPWCWCLALLTAGAPCCAKLNSPSCSIPCTSISRIPPLPTGHFSHPCPHSSSRIHRESPQPCRAPTPQHESLTSPT